MTSRAEYRLTLVRLDGARVAFFADAADDAAAMAAAQFFARDMNAEIVAVERVPHGEPPRV